MRPPEVPEAGLGGGLVDSVVCCVRGPSSRETEHNRAIGQHGSELGFADAHWDVLKVASVGKHAKYNQEDDESRDPGPEFVGVHNLVAEEGDNECADGYNNYTYCTVDVWIHGVDDLRTDNAVHTGPTVT